MGKRNTEKHFDMIPIITT